MPRLTKPGATISTCWMKTRRLPEEEIVLHIEKTGIMLPFWKNYWRLQKRYAIGVLVFSLNAYNLYRADPDGIDRAVSIVNACLLCGSFVAPLLCARTESVMWRALRPYVDYQKLHADAQRLKSEDESR